MDASRSKNGSELTLGQTLRRNREAAGLTVRQLAAHCDISIGYVSRLENDFHKHPNLNVLNRLASCLNLDYSELVGLTGQIAPRQTPPLPRYIVSRYDVTEEQANELAAQWQQILNQAHIHERPSQPHLENSK
ncbi:helix-turn-helix domain-containing protein [Flindersiella endophytica]